MTFYSGEILQRRSVYFILIVVFSKRDVKPDSCLFMEEKKKGGPHTGFVPQHRTVASRVLTSNTGNFI